MRKRIENILQVLKENDNYRILKPFSNKNQKEILNLGSNDYLNLSNNNILKMEFLQNLDSKDLYFSSSSSRILNNDFSVYEDLESFLSGYYKNKECLFFNSGYHLNISCIQALAKLPNTLFLCDKYAHASMIDGLLLGRAKFKRYAHNDMENLENLLESNTKKYDNIIILSEELFSMDGDFAPLLTLVKLKKKYQNVALYIDCAHSVGAIGKLGLGLNYELSLSEEIDFIVFTFGKAISSIGGCVLCDRIYKVFFINKARGLIYSTALPPLNVAYTLFIFKKILKMQTEREKLSKISKLFKEKLTDFISNIKDSINLDTDIKGFQVKNFQAQNFEIKGQAHIISLILGDNKLALNLSNFLLEKGIFAPAIKSPSVPKNTQRLRISLNSAITKAQISHFTHSLPPF